MTDRQLALDIKLREDATFSNYIGDAPDRMPVAGVALVHGAEGSGKSHLLQAFCHRAREAGNVAFYLDEPARHDPSIVDGLDGFDVVCIDDVDSVLGRDAWETALFHLFNTVRDSGRTLVLGTRYAPAELEVGLADLRSRLRAANTVETDLLSDRQKLRLLQEKAARQGFELGEDVGRFILSRADRSPRGLIDLLAKIEVATLARQRRVTIPLVKTVLGS